jgi:malate synthase
MRFLLNAANARWGSLYDAWYGTDALDAPPARGRAVMIADRGAAVVRAGRVFLSSIRSAARDGSWNDWDGEGVPPLADAGQLAGQTR